MYGVKRKRESNWILEKLGDQELHNFYFSPHVIRLIKWR